MDNANSKAINIGSDEYWGEWWKCPKCNCDYITRRARNFCPWCGEDLRIDKSIEPTIPFTGDEYD